MRRGFRRAVPWPALRYRRECYWSLLIVISFGPRAAKDRGTFRREIGFQLLPRYEHDIPALGIGAHGVRRIVEGEARTLAGFGGGRQRDRADFQKFCFHALVPVDLGAFLDVAPFLLGLEGGNS